MDTKRYIIRWAHKVDHFLNKNAFGGNELLVEAKTQAEAIKLSKESYLKELAAGYRNWPPIKEVKFTFARFR